MKLHLRATGVNCHMGSHSWPSTRPRLNHSRRPVLDLTTPEEWKAELTALFCVKWRHGRHLEIMTSYQNSVSRYVFTWRKTLPFLSRSDLKRRSLRFFWRGGPNKNNKNKNKKKNNKLSSDYDINFWSKNKCQHSIVQQTFKPLALLIALRGRSTRRTRKIFTTPIVSLLLHRQSSRHFRLGLNVATTVLTVCRYSQWLKWTGTRRTEFLDPMKSSPCVPGPQIYQMSSGTFVFGLHDMHIVT